MTEWGNRSIGLCLTRHGTTTSNDNLKLNYCDDSVGQIFYMSSESLIAKGKGYQIQSAQGGTVLCMAALQRRHPSIKVFIHCNLTKQFILRNVITPAFSVDTRVDVPNECQMVQSPYDESRFDVARVYHVAGLSTSKYSTLGEHYPKMLVFGGQKTLGQKFK